MEEKYIVAIIGFAGLAFGLLLRDVLMQLVMFRKQHAQVKEDRQFTKRLEQRDTLWHYATPLHRAFEALKYRLHEIVVIQRGGYLSENSAKSEYVKYKYISTIYRIAAVLGWLRAYRKERSYLSEGLESQSEEFDKIFATFDEALADGHKIEKLRLMELCKLWHVPESCLSDETILTQIAAEIYQIMNSHTIRAGQPTVESLHHTQQMALNKEVALLVSKKLNADVPTSVVEATYKNSVPLFDIKEHYIFRDWQAAIGDLMLREVTHSTRRFDVIGFGEFEIRYVRAKQNINDYDAIWFERIEGLIRNIDTKINGIFDARRAQIIGVYQSTENICTQMVKKLQDHKRKQT